MMGGRTIQRGLAGVVIAAASLFEFSATTAAEATPTHNDGLTIAVTPNPIVADEGVFIYGQLSGADHAGQTITLYHRVSPQTSFSVVSKTTTDSLGYYEFIRAEGIVVSNRSWYVRGPKETHSRTIQVGVAALVSLALNTTTAGTGQPVVFSGHVTPSHPTESVKLQEQDGLSGSGWRTVATTFTDASSNFSLSHSWAVPGDYTLRAVFPSDPRNLEGDSDQVNVSIQQQQKPSFTINSSAPIMFDGQSVTIFGTLYQAGSTAIVEPATEVTLYGKAVGGTFDALATSVTDTSGDYSFVQSPIHNEVYKVEATLKPQRGTAELFEGVQDVVTIEASSASGTVAGSVTLSGTVSPDHTGHLINLQRLGTDGYWHNVARGVVATGSSYSFSYTFGETGDVQLRARIFGGPENVGGASTPVVIMVSGVAPISSLPPI